MTVEMDCNEEEVSLQVEGDIYDEHAQCLCDMVNCQVWRGMKEVNIELCSTCYISKNGQMCFKKMNAMLAEQGVRVSFNSQFPNINSRHDAVLK